MKSEKEHSDFQLQVVRYLAGEMDAEEQKQFHNLLAGDEALREQFRDFSKIWSGVDQLAARDRYDLDVEWEALSARITAKTLTLRRAMLRIAAAVVIGLAGLAGWYVITQVPGYEQVALDQGREVLELEDGTSVTLNAGTTIKYAMDPSSGDRKVVLKGEAFFDVARDSSRPFIVEAGAAVIEVLGTSFNVSAYESGSTVEVTVTSGLVSMGMKRSGKRQLILNPGNSGVYDKEEQTLDIVSDADPNSIAWKTRELVFSETSLEEVIRVVNHVYQVVLEVGNPGIASCPITVTFNQQELSAVLNVLVETLDLSLTREEGKIILTGPGCD